MAFVDDITGAEAYNWDEAGVYQLEESDPVQGGADGIANRQARELATRTRNLNLRVTSIEDADFLNAIRGGIDASYDTLNKLKLYIDNLNPEQVDLDALEAELRAYIDGLTYLPVYRGASLLSASTINWATSTPERYMTLTAATQLDASNLIAGKTIGLKVSGAYALTFTSKFRKVTGSPSPLTTATNYIQMKCLNDASGSEYIAYTVMYLP